jgi:hypothetical protein
MEEEIARMRATQEALTKRKSRKRRYVRVQETLTVSEIADLVAEKESGGRSSGETPAKRMRAEQHCRRCGETRHNSRTCKVELEDADDSDASEQYNCVLQAAANC